MLASEEAEQPRSERWHVLNEFMETQANYVLKLTILDEIKGQFNNEFKYDANCIFHNIGKLRVVNQALAESLKNIVESFEENEPSNLADVLLNEDLFGTLKVYLANLERGVAHMEKKKKDSPAFEQMLQANENEVRGKYPKLRQSVKDMMYAPFQSAFHHRNMVERM